MAKEGAMTRKGRGGGGDDKKGGGLAQKVLAKVVRIYYAVLNFLFARLRWLATVNPSLIALTLIVGTIAVSKIDRARKGPPPPRPAEIGYSTFLDKVKHGQVAEVKLGHSIVHMRLKDDTALVTRIPRTAPPELIGALHNKGVTFAQTRPGPGQMVLPYAGLLIYLGVVAYFGWQMLGKNVSGKVGRRAQTAQLDKSLSFDDIAGIDDAKQQVLNLVDIMKNPGRYSRLGARQPTGLLLVGPPGTGKTLLARVVGVELGLPFYYASGSDFVELFVGRGAARIRELFERAYKTAPCVIFVDEMDALGKSRSNGMQLVRNDEGEQTLNQLLACMDVIDSKVCRKREGREGGGS